jgi:hypothetical protein
MFWDEMPDADSAHPRRRRFLRAVGALSVVGLAGCSGDGTGTDTRADDEATEANDESTDAPTETGGDTGTDGNRTTTGTEGNRTTTGTDGDDTPGDTDTPDGTETETPNQNVPDDPPTVASLEGGGSVQPGGTVTLTVTVENPYLFPIQSVEVNLESPGSGWTVEATGETSFGEIASANSREVSWEVTAPEDASETVTITGTFSYETSTDSVETALSRSITVFESGDVRQDGLEAYYSLDGDTATNQITGTDATVYGTPDSGAGGIRGDAFSFDRSNDEALESGQDLDLGGATVTVAAWVNFTEYDDFARLYQTGAGPNGAAAKSPGGFETLFRSDVGGDNINVVPQNSGGGATPVIDVEPDTWYFVVTVADGTTIRLHVFDRTGELDASPVSGDDTRSTTDGVPLTLMAGGTENFTTGRLDEVYAYSTNLSEGEVVSLYEGSR